MYVKFKYNDKMLRRLIYFESI